MNDHAKSTHKEVFVYPSEWEKETEDKIIKTITNDNDNDNDIDLHSEHEEDKKPKSQDISAGLRLFHSPVFRAPMETMRTAMDRPTIHHMLLPHNAK
jgi:hypothetical protein